MNKKDENMEWEKEASYLASLPRITPYRVPDEYFNGLQLRIQQSVFLAGLGQKENQGFKVPENYFEHLSEEIESRIAVANLKALHVEEGFDVPANYFEALQAKIISQTTAAKPQPKVVKLWHSDLMKYVSAACVIVLMASGLYLNQQYELKEARTTELATEQVLYDIDESVIIEHLQESQHASVSTASDAEVENYILDNFSSQDLSNN
jgi:hypothetical protein